MKGDGKRKESREKKGEGKKAALQSGISEPAECAREREGEEGGVWLREE